MFVTMFGVFLGILWPKNIASRDGCVLPTLLILLSMFTIHWPRCCNPADVQNACRAAQEGQS